MNYGIIVLTEGGLKTALKIRDTFKKSIIYTPAKIKRDDTIEVKSELSKFIKDIFNKHDIFIFIMATGIVVRILADVIKDKKTDPGVLVIDEKGMNVISLLSGHIGGANIAAEEIAAVLKAKPVITTASDVQNKVSVDMLAMDLDAEIDDMKKAKEITSMIVNNQKVSVIADSKLDLPEYLNNKEKNAASLIIISNRIIKKQIKPYVQLIPKNIIIGIGCKKGSDKRKIIDLINEKLAGLNINKQSIKKIATVDLKKDEKGILDTAKYFKTELIIIDKQQIKVVEDQFDKSKFVKENIGISSVCEPVSFLASNKSGKMILKKTIRDGITIAIWEEDIKNTISLKRGKIYVVGIGPGNLDYMCQKAINAIKESDIIIGYKTYIDLIKELIENKEIISMGMKKEIERSEKALKKAEEGKIVSVISSGDPGIYGMAGLIHEIKLLKKSSIEIEVIPGISAVNSAASILGAPLMHDFAVISLSDLLTDYNLIKKRIENAASADFVISIYNPKSNNRITQIKDAKNIILKYRNKNTPVGIIKNAKRENQEIFLTTIEKMTDFDIDMSTVIIIGNSSSFISDDKIITPRGYKI